MINLTFSESIYLVNFHFENNLIIKLAIMIMAIDLKGLYYAYK